MSQGPARSARWRFSAAMPSCVTKIFVSEPNANRRRHIEAFGVRRPGLDPLPRTTSEDRAATPPKKALVWTPPSSVRGTKPPSTPASRPCAIGHRRTGRPSREAALVDPALWALKDITVEATWCYPVTMWPRVIAIIERESSLSKDITGQIGAEDSSTRFSDAARPRRRSDEGPGLGRVIFRAIPNRQWARAPWRLLGFSAPDHAASNARLCIDDCRFVSAYPRGWWLDRRQ